MNEKFGNRYPILNTYVNALSMGETLECVEKIIKERKPTQHVVINASKVNLMEKDSKLREIVKSNILIVKNDRKKPEENRKYDNVDISILEAFLCEVDSYLLLLGLDEEIFEEEEYGE